MTLQTSSCDPSQVLVERQCRKTQEDQSDATPKDKRSSWVADVVARVIEFFVSVVLR